MVGNGLPERELRGLLEILGEVHHAEDVASFREGLLNVLPTVVPSLYTSYNEIGADGRPLVVIVSPELDQRWLELWGQLGHQNPLVRHHLTTRDPRAHRMSDVIDGPSFRRLELYREVFAPLGVHHQMAITLPAPPKLLIGLAVVAPDDYTDAQRRMFDLARPHLIQARANAAARERLRDVLHAIEHGLDDVGQAIVVTDDRERIAFASRAGRDALALLDGGIRGDGERLPGALQGVTADHSVMAVRDDAPLVVRRLPSERGTTVFLFERSERPAPLAHIEALGLSTREAEVLRRFMRGESTAEAATSLQISPRTIHKHAERIYRKLGVTDRIAAISTAWASLDTGR
jgi:DNA-binding CsgD family transcriptional regulator